MNKNESSGSYYILLSIVITGLIFSFSWGISGNDFWWHVKAGEWMMTNNSLPDVDTFSWYANENNIKWVSHEWMSQIFFYYLHSSFGDIGIYLFSFACALTMTLVIFLRQKEFLEKNIWLSTIFLLPMIMQIKTMFFCRPHLLSFFLIYLTLICLYRLREDENSNLVFFIPIIAGFWVNLHGGSSTLSYILCFIFLFSGLFEFSFGKLSAKRFSRKQFYKYLAVSLLSIAFLVINPYGIDMLTYPYANMGDDFMQKMIKEWSAPDAKIIAQLLFFHLPLFIVGAVLIVTDKKIRFIDFLLFVFFAYMFLRSLRFTFLFFMTSTFYFFYYMPPSAEKQTADKRLKKIVLLSFILMILWINFWSISNAYVTAADKKLISVALSDRFIRFIKNDKPKRLFNEYDFGEALIFNDIETFVDARADLFSPHNLRDYRSLVLLKYEGNSQKEIFIPEYMITKYDFDAFLLKPTCALAAYLKSLPMYYDILEQDEQAVYFKRKKS